MNLLKLVLYGFLSGAILIACKKNGSGSNNAKKQRIQSISDGLDMQAFEYDGEGRITRLHYNASNALKFTYSPIGVNIQRLGSGDIPDPDRRYDFTIVNGRITHGKEFMPNKITRNFIYGYDDQGRLTNIFVMVQYDAVTSETHSFVLSYNSQNNVQEIHFVRKDNGGADKSDSVAIRKTYHNGKFITWGQMGFDYFGVASMAERHLGYGITVPFLLAPQVYPGNNALKSETQDDYYWNNNTKKWVFQNTSGYTIEEAQYQYDANGRLIKYANMDINWQ